MIVIAVILFALVVGDVAAVVFLVVLVVMAEVSGMKEEEAPR